MGKKGRRTRWRTLTITDEHSDSEESNTTTSGHRVPKGYPQKSYYSRFTYSSQSTPTRRYQCDGTKSTRSSSTASENKITFNEDEYTRITTPRQDVLFKKGYLNKPKTYQTQTSTGNSTTSTGNSTGNGTPDHQSTDLEYESQFVFPNGFVDQNGIYYVNSFEPYPVMVYNPPTYYSEYENVKTKRCSTGSLTESTSPNNEEASQDPSQNETATTISELNQVYSVVYPGFYYNGACQPQVEAADPEPRRVKKRRRRKRSKSPAQEGTTTESSSEEEEEEGEEEEDEKPEPEDETDSPKTKYDLKPDAEEFVPRAYRLPETIPMEANVQFIKIPSNFVPVPILNPMGEFNAFIPHGIPINFVPPNYVNFVPYKTPSVQMEEKEEKNEEETVKETVEVPKNTTPIDIAKIVSKLEEAAKEQDENVKGENQNKSTKKRFRYQKVELRKPPPSPEPRRKPTSPKKEESIPKPIRNYSDTLKKSMVPQQCERHERHMEKTKINRTPSKETTPKKTPPKITNEWISVSSRKKRKNKNVEETEDFEEIEIVGKEEIEIVKKEEIEIVKKEEIEIVEKKEIDSREENETVPIVATPPPPPPPPPQPVEPEKKPKKKTKKNQKTTLPVTKRVIITDIDLSIEEPKIEEPIVEEKKPDEPPEEQVEKKESPEKKSKKKKKKVSKLAILSDSSSSTTLNLNDDSYDFLLDESLEKTNVEVSQELDKMIQRGMYNSLEEKIKSMNIESNDNFFKSIIGNISSRESSVEKNHPFVKNPDLGKLLTLKPTMATFDRKSNDFLGETATPNPLGGGGADAKPPQDENLYPITKAVKEWMTKARETTPDVEILKSPSTIFREFGDETDYTRKSSASSIEEGEDVLETYGDELKIEETKNYPKHGNLPYRAICCSIM